MPLLVQRAERRQTLDRRSQLVRCQPKGAVMADLFQFIDNIDADKQAMVIKRLENRAQMPKFAAIRENYFDKIGLPVTGRIHELGCGTGAVCRAIASRPGFLGTVVGSDLCAYRKVRFGRTGDEARRPGHATRCGQPAEPGARPANLCPMSGAFSRCCNRSHKILGLGANAARLMR